jgi:hypothetical protein
MEISEFAPLPFSHHPFATLEKISSNTDIAIACFACSISSVLKKKKTILTYFLEK